MVSRKQHLKRISALAADGKRVAKRARQSRQASSSPSNLDNSDHDNSINIIESQPQELAKNSVPDVESQCMEFSSESEEFDVEKSDIDDEESDSEMEDEQFDWGEETDENFSHQDPKIPPPSVLKWDSLGEKNLRGVWGVGTKRTQRRKEKQQRELREAAQTTRSIRSMFVQQNHAQEKRANDPDFMTRDRMNSLSSVNPDSTHTPIGAIERLKLARAQASADLDKLLRLKTEQKKKYGCLLQTKPNHHCRHLLVQALFSMQAHKLEKPKLFQGKSRRDLAIMVAHSHNARGGTARQIVRWERS